MGQFWPFLLLFRALQSEVAKRMESNVILKRNEDLVTRYCNAIEYRGTK